MAFKRGVSLYSYQQAQYLKELDLEAEIREVTQNLDGADGIEIVDEMSLRYPDPGEDFVTRWFDWLDRYGAVPVTMDVCMDVLQFRDHVMTYDECADRLRHDIRLAKRLGFANVRTLSVVPIEVIESALPLAESLDIRLGKEIHQPMTLEGQAVQEILDLIDKTGTEHLGIVPDFGIFQTRPADVLLEWFVRRGAQPAAGELSIQLSRQLGSDDAPFRPIGMAQRTAGNLRADFARYLRTGECEPDLEPAFAGVVQHAEENLDDPQPLDVTVVFEALMLSRTSPRTLRELAGRVINVHGKFNNMTEIAGRPGEYHDVAIDYESSLAALQDGGFTGYVNSEYEGQRYFQDGTRGDLKDEVEQVRRHHEMLRRLTKP
jgi:sugar phosphate isomerase/epimerase